MDPFARHGRKASLTTEFVAGVSVLLFFSAIAYVGGTTPGIIVVGSSASGFSKDELHTWTSFVSDGFNAVDSKQGVVYAVGASGKIAGLQK